MTDLYGIFSPIIICLTLFVMFFKWGRTFAEAAAGAVVCTFMSISLICQFARVMGTAVIAPILESALLTASLYYLLEHRKTLLNTIHALTFFLKSFSFTSVCTLFCLFFMAASALFFIPSSTSFIGENAAGVAFVASDAAASETTKEIFSLSPMNHNFHAFRAGAWHASKQSQSIFGLLGLLSVGFSTYALARRYGWPSTALTVSLMVLSMPRMVLNAMVPGQENILAATALFCLLSMYRAVESPGFADLSLLFLGICFCVGDNRLCFLLPSVLTALAFVVLFRRHGWITWKNILKGNPGLIPVVAIFGMIYFQLPVFSFNILNHAQWINPAPDSMIQFNDDPLVGTIANVIRYLFQSIHIPEQVDEAFSWMLGFSWRNMLQWLWDHLLLPLFGEKGAHATFKISWAPSPDLSWFGPFGFFMVLPAAGYALFRGPRRLKAVALAFLFYFFLIALIISWMPANAGFLNLFFYCMGFSIAFFLPPWRVSERGQRILRSLCLFLFLHTLIQTFF